MLIAPTVFGNVMLGPTADDIDDKAATGSTPRAWTACASGRRIMPALLAEEVTAVYAGLRAATEHSDYQLVRTPAPGTSARRHPLDRPDRRRWRSAEAWRRLAPPARHCAQSPMPRYGCRASARPPRPYPSGEYRRDATYGTIVCHCERVTPGEIRDAARTIPPATSTACGAAPGR